MSNTASNDNNSLLKKKSNIKCIINDATHLLCGELCMVLQTRTFKFCGCSAFNSKKPNSSFTEYYDASANNYASSLKNTTLVVSKIAFSSVGDPSVRQV